MASAAYILYFRYLIRYTTDLHSARFIPTRRLCLLQTLEAVLAQSLPVLPEEVLDAPPPVLAPSQSPLLLQAPLPHCEETQLNLGLGLDVRLGERAHELASEADKLVAGAA